MPLSMDISRSGLKRVKQCSTATPTCPLKRMSKNAIIEEKIEVIEML
jgi:hypothetical protein